MEVTFYSFQMNCYFFIEIYISKNEMSLLENIKNNPVNFEKTLNNKSARCSFHLAEDLYIWACYIF